MFYGFFKKKTSKVLDKSNETCSLAVKYMGFGFS